MKSNYGDPNTILTKIKEQTDKYIKTPKNKTKLTQIIKDKINPKL
jgi:flagellar basal body-associated protein FliL